MNSIKDKARQAFRDQQSQDTEGGCPDAASYIGGYVDGHKEGYATAFAELRAFTKQLKDAPDPTDEALRDYAFLAEQALRMGTEEYVMALKAVRAKHAKALS